MKKALIKQWEHWHPLWERKKNNKGSSIVMVIVVMAIVAILVTLIMTMALTNFRMKNTNLEAQKNFYTAEMALEEIRLGLCDDMSEAMSVAYVDTVQKYSLLDAQGREQNFRDVFLEQLKNNIGYQTDGTYSLEHLSSFLNETKYNEDKNAGAKVLDTDNHVNIEERGITLKNVSVAFYGERGYFTEIKTDIQMNYPAIHFSQNSEMPDLTRYALIAEDHLDIQSGVQCEIQGNAYLGSNATVVNHASLKVTPNANSSERGMLISGDMIKGDTGTKLDISEMEVWSKDLVVDSSTLKAQDVAVYLQNDFVLSNSMLSSTNAAIKGEFYGYGNIKTAVRAESLASDETKLQEIQQNPADYSSSIIINGIRSSLDLSGLRTMKISGNSYINGKDAYTDEYGYYGNMNTGDVLMGESLSIRADQVAYLVPPECIAPEALNGGLNPMPISQYSLLMNELKETYGSEADKRLVDLDVQTKKYGGSLESFGVNGWQIEAQQVNGIGSMVYVFLKFDSTESANAFFRMYYDKTNPARLGSILDLYDGAGIRLPEEVLKDTVNNKFYFNGNVLASDAAKLYVPDRLGAISQEKAEELEQEEIAYQDSYAALNTKLFKEYEKLTGLEKSKTVYENLVKNMIFADNAYTIPAGGKEIFYRETGEAAVVANGDYTIGTESTVDFSGEEDAKLSVVIASGDITVEEDFTGLLIAGGTIYVKNNVVLAGDVKAAGKALLAVNADGIRVYDYLVDGERYVIAGASEEVAESGILKESIDVADYVIYENWSKQ